MPCKRNRYHFLKNWFIHIWRLFGDDYYSSGYLKFCNPYANSVNTFATWIFSSRVNMNYHNNSKNNNNYFLTFLYLSLLKWSPLNNRGIVQKLKRKYNENKNNRELWNLELVINTRWFSILSHYHHVNRWSCRYYSKLRHMSADYRPSLMMFGCCLSCPIHQSEPEKIRSSRRDKEYNYTLLCCSLCKLDCTNLWNKNS